MCISLSNWNLYGKITITVKTHIFQDGVNDMIILSKENITEYLKEKMPYLDYSRPLFISAIGEGSLEDDGDGYINFVFRVSDGKWKLILKQARSEGRVAGFKDMSLERASIEYAYMKIGNAIVPEYLPKLYFYDAENLAFAVEDVSHLKISRFQLNKSMIFPQMARQAADYLAKMHFYTSDYYLDTDVFRKLQIRFTNHKMRSFFDDQTFTNRDYGDLHGTGFELDPEYAPFIRELVFDPAVVLERYKLRDLYMRKAEVLLHADFHTSNIFVGQDEMKTIDMEYAFFGPAAYDLGYLQSHLLSQFICGAFRPYDSEQERITFVSFILCAMQSLFEEYCRVFFQCWDEDAKPIYQGVPGIQEYIQKQLLQDMIGFCASSNIFRCAGNINYPEYDDLTDQQAKRNAVKLSLMMDHHMILRREKYRNVKEWVDDLLEMLRDF